MLTKNVGGKFKVLAPFSNLLQRELPLPREGHGDCALRSEFRNEVQLEELAGALFTGKPISGGNLDLGDVS